MKKISWVVFIAFFLLIIYFHELIGYGIAQGKGQFKVLWNAQPIVEVLQNPNIADSVRQKLLMVNEIRTFAFDELGLTPSKNYTTFFDQLGKDILWVVTACAPYKFEPKEWSFPFIGSFSYKGFFDEEKANSLAIELQKEGFDVAMSSVSGWSTLGWFKDPVLSNMLNGSVGSLSNTLIHELTHSTLFIPDSMTFNENLASFVGTKGALKFLETKYGHFSIETIEYSDRLKDRKKFTQYMVLAASQLDSIYQGMAGLKIEQKQKQKQQFIELFSANIDTVSFIYPLYYKQLLNEQDINNAGFISFLKYRERQQEFEAQLVRDFNNDLSKFIHYWRAKYPK